MNPRDNDDAGASIALPPLGWLVYNGANGLIEPAAIV